MVPTPGPNASEGTLPADPPVATPTPKPKSNRFLFVDALRGIAALWVVVVHAYNGKHLDLVAARMPDWAVAVFFKSGALGVPIFFVLSGFVIAWSVARYKVDGAFLGRFALRRSIRLDPPYWASIILVLIQGAVSKIVMPTKPYSPPTAPQLTAHVFYLQDLLGYREINPAYWTLPFEIQFYLVFCLLVGLAHATRRDENDHRSLYFIFVPSLLIAALWPLRLMPFEIPLGLFPPLWYGFLLGMLACWTMIKLVRPIWFFAYALIVGVGGGYQGDLFPVACALTAVLLLVAHYANGLATWLGARWIQFLGLISYSLYLVHNPVTGAMYNVGYRITGRSVASEVFWFVIMLVVNVAAAAAFWWIAERPSLALAHRLRLQPKRPIEPATNVDGRNTSPTDSPA